MPSWQRVYLVACAGVIGYALAYVLSVFSAWPKLVYYPYERRFGIAPAPPDPMASSYLGILLWGLGGALVAGALAWLFTRLYRREVGRRLLLLFGAWALTAFLLAGLFFTWGLLVA